MRPYLLIAIAVLIVFAAAFAVFTVHSHQRQDDNILAEIVVWPGGGGSRGTPIYYFVVTNDGTLIGYHGLSRNDNWHPRRSNFIRTVHEREQLTLSEDDFLHISELVGRIVSIPDPYVEDGTRLTNSHVMFLHNGNVYENNTSMSEPLHNLVNVLFRLTSLSGNQGDGGSGAFSPHSQS